MYTLTRTNSDDAHFKALVKLLDQELLDKHGEQQAFFDQFNKTDTIKHIVVLYSDGEAAACGAIKQFAADTLEVKRMFVKPAFRGLKLATTILSELESWATELGYTNCILETSIQLPEAIALYKKNGYAVTANYGQYIGVANSVCFRKKLTR